VIETELFLELLMSLLTDPSGFDCGGEHLEARVGWHVRHLVFLLASRPAFADKPDLVAWHALHTIIEHPMLMAIRTRTRRAAKRHVNLPFVPRRQLTLCHFLSANNASAETGG